MSILKVAQLGHPVLRQVAATVADSAYDAELARLARDMTETMVEYRGVGLAAPQVREPLRMFVAHIGEESPIVAVNPTLTPLDESPIAIYEGCLSIAGYKGLVPRKRGVRLSARNEHGEEFSRDLVGFPAIVVQHEYDHLDGVVYLDRMPDMSKLMSDEEYQRMLTEQAEQGRQ